MAFVRIGFCLLMSETFRPWTIDQPLLLPPSVQDFVGQDHLARFAMNGRRPRRLQNQPAPSHPRTTHLASALIYVISRPHPRWLKTAVCPLKIPRS